MMRKPTQLFMLLFVGIVLWWSRADAGSAVCFSCHEKSAFSGPVVHQPVASGECVTCHNPHVARYDGLLSQSVADLCYSCHTKEAKAFTKGIMHIPVSQGKCLACHEPHKADAKGLINGRLRDRCLACHKTLTAQYQVTHAPYARGQCEACHQPHNAGNTMLLRDDDPDRLCSSCHNQDKVRQAHPNYPVAVKGCLTCHNPHGSSRANLVRNTLHAPYAKGCTGCHVAGQSTVPVETCLGCHKEISGQLRTIHSHLIGGNSCTNCHSPHAGDEKRLLRGRQMQICRTCHEDTYRRFEKSTYVHTESVKECNECHAVHGSNHMAMLRGDGNGVCSRCHETQGKFTHPVGDKARDQRTGQPMTCVNCHNPHGSEYKGQMRLNPEKELCNQCHQGY
ncbi:MAG: hypothetical protein A2521_08770 [Deltaproteobacteria bacterium RIFOXYD12_FULL_57_12]|nr:MAG: hypothetical protein A2521_08770 [Deltaproteobacteria bacterium RIFOXYD12_FULL_57_12]